MKKLVLLIGIILSVIMFFGAHIVHADPPYFFWPARADFEVGQNPKGVTTADFNNDGNPDFAICALDSNYISC